MIPTIRICILTALLAAWGMTLPLATGAEEIAGHRSPVDVVLSPDQTRLLTVNQTSDSLSLVDAESGALLSEIRIGAHPAMAAFYGDGKHFIATCSHSGELYFGSVKADRLTIDRKVHLGFEPTGLAVTTDESLAYVALAMANEVAEVEIASGKVLRKIAVGRWPRYLAVDRAGKKLAVGTSGDRGISVVDLATGKLEFMEKFIGLNIGHIQMDEQGRAHFPWMVYRRNPISPNNIRIGWVLASRLGRVRTDEHARRDALSLDPRGKAIADPHGLALTPDGRFIVSAASGTQELLIFQRERLPWMDYGGTDHIDPELLADEDRFVRIPLGGRPMGVRISSDSKTAYVANYMTNAIQVVDLQTRKVVREIALCEPQPPSAARRGEAIFHDAGRSLDQWYSCHTCHYEGGGNSVSMDTLNDSRAFTFKTVLPLYSVTETSPWTWHGWQTSLPNAMEKSLTSTMQGDAPTDAETRDMIAYLKTLKAPPNPFRKPNGELSAGATRGKVVFESDTAGCTNCHSGPHFTDHEIHDVGLGETGAGTRGYNTPSLVGAYRKVIYLHDGRSRSLEDLLSGPHAPEKVTGNGALTETQRADLIEYVKSL